MFLIVVCSTLYPQSWIRQDDGINEDINTIHFKDAFDGYFAGTAGNVYKTSDGGNTWNKVTTGQNGTINCISSNSKGIWAVGNSALLLLSTDNGTTWNRQNLPTTNRLNSISFYANNGLIAADGGQIFRTSDAGETWNLITLSTTVLRSVTILENRAVIVGGEVSPVRTIFIATSSDAGGNWQVVENAAGPPLTSVQMVNQNTVFAVGINGLAIKSNDAGTNWFGLPTSTLQWLYGMSFLDENTGFICGGNVNEGIIIKTTDGGSTFLDDTPIGSKWLYSIYMHKDTEGFCVGATGGKLYRKSPDATWSQLETKTISTLNGVSFYNEFYGLAVGDTGVVVTTSNGGGSWEIASVPTYNDLNAIGRFDTTIVVAGDSGLVVKSFGNGAVWVKTSTPGSSDLLAVDLVSHLVGFAGGRNGSLIRTVDGGLTWQTINSPTTMTIRSMYFFDESVGYITGGDFVGGPEGTGFLYRTTNGGTSWQSILSGIPIINAIEITGAQKIMIVGVKGFAASTPNGGLSWNFMNINTLQWLYAIDFQNENIGYITGGNVNTGMVWATVDGGATWQEFQLSMVQWLYAVTTLPTKVFTCGYGGKMLSTPISIIPVELTSFTANITDKNEVVLSWITQTETNNFGFEIERDKGTGWEKVNFVSGNGSSATPHNYQFTDNSIKSIDAKNVRYRLKQLDYDGSFSYSDVIEVTLPGTDSFVLLQNYPNPFNPSTNINFSLPIRSQVKIELFDILGVKVADIVDQEYGPGYHTIQFDAAKLPSGIYFYQMNAGKYREVKRMNLLK